MPSYRAPTSRTVRRLRLALGVLFSAAMLLLVTPGASAATSGAAGGSTAAALTSNRVLPAELMYVGLGLAVVGIAVLVASAAGALAPKRLDEVARNIDAYTRDGAKHLAMAGRPVAAPGVAAQAVAVAENVLGGSKGLEASLGRRLEAAGLALKPAEWLLVHVGIALGGGLLGLLVSAGGLMVTTAGLLVGALLPWLFLGVRGGRRTKAFKGQLADTLQLMSGSLSAGLSLAQSVQTVVSEGSDPMAGEFRRALVESRLGVDIDEALLGIAERMESTDFRWVVMSIRIQREVGGNLAELLNTVAETIREREYLQRQVLALSAEGRLSVWILGGLPPGFMAYLLLANRDYLRPMYTTPVGMVLLGVTAVLLGVGVLWMKKLVKVTV